MFSLSHKQKKATDLMPSPIVSHFVSHRFEICNQSHMESPTVSPTIKQRKRVQHYVTPSNKKLETTKKYYLKIDMTKHKEKVIKTLDSMYDFHGRIVLDEPSQDYIETIDSRGRKTRYLKKEK